jgi:hypothetical protein
VGEGGKIQFVAKQHFKIPVDFSCDIRIVERQAVSYKSRTYFRGSRVLNHHHQPINVPTAGAQAFRMDYT